MRGTTTPSPNRSDGTASSAAGSAVALTVSHTTSTGSTSNDARGTTTLYAPIGTLRTVSSSGCCSSAAARTSTVTIQPDLASAPPTVPPTPPAPRTALLHRRSTYHPIDLFVPRYNVERMTMEEVTLFVRPG